MKKNKEQPKKDNSCICGICNKIIFTKIDNYCHLLDYFKGHFIQEGYYHTSCYKDKIKGQQDRELSLMKKKAFGILNKASEMLGMKEEEGEVIQIGR